MSNTITVFFSMTGQTIWKGMQVVNLDKGNTNWAAEYVQQAVGGDLFEIKTTKVYPEDHFEMIEEAKREMQAGERHSLIALPQNWDSYDTVFLCYPNWWAGLPCPVLSFVEQMDWAGKTIHPLVTSEGSGAVGVPELRRLCQGATVTEALSVRGSDAKESQAKIAAWAKKQIA